MVSLLKKLMNSFREKSISQELQLRFLQRLYRLLQGGYPILDSLKVIQWDYDLKEIAIQIERRLKGGDPFDKALEENNFHPSIVTYLYFVRANGNLEESIRKCVEMYDLRITNIKKFQQVTRYPFVLLFIFFLLLYFINQMVLPAFIDLFQSSRDASSTVLITMILLDYASKIVTVLFIILFLLMIFWIIHKHKFNIETQIKIYQLIPIYRNFIQIHTSFLFASHFSSLLKTGMPMKDILIVITSQKKLPILSYYATLMAEELRKGLYLTNLLAQLPLLDKQIATIFQNNIDMHSLSKDLSIYAEILTEELQRKIMKGITYIQPVFFTILAGFIVLIYIMLMWPMFQLIKTI